MCTGCICRELQQRLVADESQKPLQGGLSTMVSLAITTQDRMCMGCTLIVHDGKQHCPQKAHDVASIEHLEMVAPAGQRAA